jgi:cell wall-associated NlpC family hydrolase
MFVYTTKISTRGSIALLLSLCAACSTPPNRGDGTTSGRTVTPSSNDTVPQATVHQPSYEPKPTEVANDSDFINDNLSGANLGAAMLDGARVGEEIALRALALVGKPYRYGGADLDGFDCSGLVYFIYHQLGMEVPRTAKQQQQAAVHVARKALVPGDLVFFKIRRNKGVSHVGVYVGDNRFVHAPQSGKPIELRTLDDHYFESRWVAAGRFD